MATFFTSDLHLGHENIIKLCNRPFHDAREMENIIRINWNATVRPEDDVVVLGDIALGSIRHFESVIRSLHGTKFLVPGNHDACWGGHRRKERAWRKRQEYLDAGFFYILDDITPFELKGFGQVRLSHLPTEGDSHLDDRYNEQRPAFDGRPVICGHVHEAWKVKGLNINVGIDQWGFRPVPDVEIAALAHKICQARAAAPARHPLIGAHDAH